MAPQSVFEQKETKLRIRGISYCEISLGGFALLTTGNSANISLSFLICPASVCWLMRDIRNRKVPSNSLNLLSEITSIHSYSTRSSSINTFYIKKSRLDIQKGAFSRVGAKIWNEISASFRESSQKNASKRNFSLFLVDILIEHDEYIDISQITSADLKTHK